MLEQDVALPDDREDVVRVGGLGRCEVGVGERAERVVLEVGALEVGDEVEPAQVQRLGQAVDVLLVHAELADEHVEDVPVDLVLDLEPHGRAEPAARQLLLQRRQEVLGVVLLHLEVLVAGDPEGEAIADLHAGEQHVEVGGDDLLERHEAGEHVVGERGLPAGRVDVQQARQQGRDLDPREVLLARLRVDQRHRQVEREPGDVGERVRRIDGERRQDGEDLVGEEPGERLALVVGQLVPADDGDALLLQGWKDPVAVQDRLHGLQLVGDEGDLLEDLPGLQARCRAHGQPGGDPALEAGHADHEELVEVGGEDREEAGTLQQRHGLVGGELQHPLVELQPGDLAVEEAVRGQPGLVGDAGGLDNAHEPAVGGSRLEPRVVERAGARDRDLGGVAVGELGRLRRGRHAFILTPRGERRRNTSRPP